MSPSGYGWYETQVGDEINLLPSAKRIGAECSLALLRRLNLIAQLRKNTGSLRWCITH